MVIKIGVNKKFFIIRVREIDNIINLIRGNRPEMNITINSRGHKGGVINKFKGGDGIVMRDRGNKMRGR